MKRIIEIIFPPRCVFCRKITHGETVCSACRDALPVCSRLFKGGEFYESCAASFYYKDSVRRSVLRYKFGGKRGYASAYADLLADTVRTQYPGGFDIITWVPVSAKRMRKRGYDQSRLLCERTAQRLELEAAPTLKKIIHTPPQSELKSAEKRRANVLGAYGILPDTDVKGKRILIIDDILTTGATLSECARTLLMAGADSVICAVLAYAGK